MRKQPLKSFDVKMSEYEVDQTKIPGTFEERLELLRDLGKNAQNKFEAKYKELPKWFDEHDQLNLLSFTSYYFFTSKEGDDEEARTGKIEFPPHLQEILQALSLIKERNYEPKPFIGKIPYDLQNSLKEIKELLELKFFNFPEEIKIENDLEKHKLRVDFMVDTMAVRGWCYKHQLEKMISDLCNGVEKEFVEEFGFAPHSIFEIIDRVIDNVNIKLKKHQEKVREFVTKNDYLSVFIAYEKVFPHIVKSTKETRETLFNFFKRDLEQLKASFMSHSDLFLHRIFTFSIDDIFEFLDGELEKNKIVLIMDKLSFTFGELKDKNTEHFILNNPIHKKPFIKTDENLYYSSILGTIEHLKLEILESFSKENKNLNSKFSEVKAEYLENSVNNLFKANFPDAKIFQNVYWFDEKNERHETDLIVSMNDFLFVVESKSGILTESAKRGATERLFNNLKDLIEAPSYQASKFINYIHSQDVEVTIYDKKKRKQFLPKPRYIIPLGVTLAQFGVNNTILKKLIKLELIDKVDYITSSINLNDLEVVFEILESIPQKIHYLQRRKEIEDSLEFAGDEMDLLAMYLENGFNFGKLEKDQTHFLNFVLLSKKIDTYITNFYNGFEQEKPKLTLTKWWEDILQMIDEKKSQNWLEYSYGLLSIPYNDQIKFEKLLKEQSNKMLKGLTEDKNNNFLIYKSSSDDERAFKLIGYTYQSVSITERDEMISNMIGSENELAKSVNLIGINLDNYVYPYSVLASKPNPVLFN